MKRKFLLGSLIAAFALPLSNGLSPIRSRSTLLPHATNTMSEQLPPSVCSTPLLESIISTNGGARKPTTYDKVDWSALVKYAVGLAAQMSLMFGFLTGLDKAISHYALKVPFAVNVILFYAFNLKASLFSILPSRRSDGLKMSQEKWAYNERNRPSWTPPGFAFVLGWPLLTFGLRAYTGAIVVQSLGSYANPAIMSLMLHFGIGTLWSTS